MVDEVDAEEELVVHLDGWIAWEGSGVAGLFLSFYSSLLFSCTCGESYAEVENLFSFERGEAPQFSCLSPLCNSAYPFVVKGVKRE